VRCNCCPAPFVQGSVASPCMHELVCWLCSDSALCCIYGWKQFNGVSALCACITCAVCEQSGLSRCCSAHHGASCVAACDFCADVPMSEYPQTAWPLHCRDHWLLGWVDLLCALKDFIIIGHTVVCPGSVFVVPAGVCGAERRLAQLRLFSVPMTRCPGCPGLSWMF
jgi:hypothetical protein